MNSLSPSFRFFLLPLRAVRSVGTATLLFAGPPAIALIALTVSLAFDSWFADSSSAGVVLSEPQNSPNHSETPSTVRHPSATMGGNRLNQERCRRYYAVGRDMKWHFYEQTENEPAAQSQTTMRGDVIELQVGQTAVIDVRSDDYLYLLTLPDGRSQIGVPEMSHQIEFLATEPGRFELRADPMCGFRFLHDDEVQGLLVVNGPAVRPY